MNATLIPPLCLTALLAVCASMSTDVEPILDRAANGLFQSDPAAFRSLALDQSQLDHQTMAAATTGGGIGGMLGEADGDGDVRETITLNCLRGRGHAVVS